MNYSVRYFYESQPKWKKKRDAIATRLIYRPCAFLLASICANLGISSNTVSRFSILFGIATSICFLIPGRKAGIIASVMVIIWIVLDCTDGNLARSVESLPYGEFLDAMSGYFTVGLLFNVIGFRAYFEAGNVFYQNPLIILIGAIASSCDSISRLVYQKYINSSYELGINGKVAHDGSNATKIDKARVWIDMNIGIGGILPILLLITNIFGGLWMVVCGYAIYEALLLIGTSVYLNMKTKKIQKK